MLRRIANDEVGVSAPEYAVLLLLLVTSVVIAINALGNVTASVFSNTANGINDAGGSSGTVYSSSPTDPTSTASNTPSSSPGGGHGPRGDSSPGHQMQQDGPAPGSPGASGFTRGHNK
jgi:Flp pilus assembly pilin Flp